jgi:uncharacterized protein YodC (DUF2158 family)
MCCVGGIARILVRDHPVITCRYTAILSFNVREEIMDLKPGDVVILKSGGHPVTVAEVSEDSVECLWMGGEGDLFRETFPIAVLERAELDPDEDDDEEDDGEDEEDDDDEDEEDEHEKDKVA